MTEISRRRAMTAMLAGSAAGLGLPATNARATEPLAAVDQRPGQCILLPQAIEGPYYFDPTLLRSDIAEGRPGAPLRLALRVIESGSCTPITGARVDVWHADAEGIYSGYALQGPDESVSTQGQTYLRGTQMTGSDGRVSFTTIYPGWYPGRTPHIHVKVFLDDKSLVTGQMYFPDDFTGRIYASREPYTARAKADTTNAADGIFRDGERDGGGTVLAMSEESGTILAALVIGVDRSGAAAQPGQSFWRRLLGQ